MHGLPALMVYTTGSQYYINRTHRGTSGEYVVVVMGEKSVECLVSPLQKRIEKWLWTMHER
jgi:hypothetical protein